LIKKIIKIFRNLARNYWDCPFAYYTASIKTDFSSITSQCGKNNKEKKKKNPPKKNK